MGEDKYAFPRAALHCSGQDIEPQPPETETGTLYSDSYYQCMCDAGVTSYCSRVSGADDASLGTNTDWTLTNSFVTPSLASGVGGGGGGGGVGGLDLLNLTPTPSPETANQLDTMVTWIGVFSIILCVSYMVFRCSRQGASLDEAGPEAGAPMLGAAARSAAAAAGAAGSAPGGGGGGGGDGGESGGDGAGGGGVAPPADLPPPYDLVYEENITPPTYEEVIQEEAKIHPSEETV